MNLNKKINVVFMPYKITMWDSLQSIYQACINDDRFNVEVVVIPYYEKSTGNLIYEGKRFKDIDLIHYNDYELEKKDIDYVFVHNVYDDFNSITEVDSRFFTSNLKKYTKKLIYVPYYIPTPSFGDRTIYTIKGIDNVDKIILSSEFTKKAAIIMGLPEEKILVLGSPKFDYVKNKLKNPTPILEWEKIIDERKTILLDTGCLFFDKGLESFLMIERIFDFVRYNNAVIIWRPHPLTKSSAKSCNPEFEYKLNELYENIKNKCEYYPNIILDETDDYVNSFNYADLLITDGGSLFPLFMVTQNPIMILNEKELINNLVFDKDDLYYFYDKEEPWYSFLYDFVNFNYDENIKKGHESLKLIYMNTNENCGEKIKKYIIEDISV